jgi:hypothetical protein
VQRVNGRRISMATIDEIQRRVEQADIARSAKRSAAAQQVGELAQCRAAVAEQLEDIERQLGEVLAAASDVIEIDELARFTDVAAADLTRWLTARKPPRTKRKKPATGTPGPDSDKNRGQPAARTVQAPTTAEPAVPRADAAPVSSGVAAAVT